MTKIEQMFLTLYYIYSIVWIRKIHLEVTSYKNKQFVLLGMTFLSVAGIAGCSKVELAQSTVTLELGDELSENVADYLQNPDEKILEAASLDLSAVDETKVGSYNAAISYDGKN